MITNQRNEVDGKTPRDEFGLVQPGSFWGYPWCWQQGGVECQGVAHPLTEDDIHAASFGLTFIDKTWGPSYGLSALGSEWTMGKVLRFAVTQSSGTISAKPEVLLTGIQNPGPLLTLPDGDVLISSWATGEIYVIHHGVGGAAPAASGNPSTTTPASTAPAAAATPTTGSTGSVKISTATISGLGPVLVNAQGRTLYMFVPDKHSKVTCVSACAALWPPAKLSTGQKATASGEVKSSLLSSDPDPEGGQVATYAGWPLYTYAADASPGTANGQAIDANGGLWYVISPAGKVIEKHP